MPQNVKKKQKLKDSLKYSFWDGFFASVQFGIVEQFSTPFALFLGANNIAIGWLNFIRNTLVSIVQISSADVTQMMKSRKRLITWCVFFAAFLWIPTFFAPFLFGASGVWVFILLFGLTSSFNMFATPAWASLMSEYIPHRKRGVYFGWRGMVLGFVYAASILAAGLILHYYYLVSLFWGFAVLALIASVSRFVSWFFVSKMYEPAWRVKSTDYFSFAEFIGRFPRGNFARFSVFYSFLLLGVSLASPFLPVYLLKELRADYLAYTLIMGAAVFTTFATQRYWGRFADRYGNAKIIKTSAVLIVSIPILWMFSGSFAYLFLIQLWGGFLWAGFNLSSSNFIYDSAVSTKRERCIAYFNFLSGVGIGAGALLGGFLYRHLPALHGSQFLTLFLVSGAVRFIAAFLIWIMVEEVKQVENIRTRMLLLDLSGIRSLGLLGRELILRRKS